jgi:hypothetical protein
MKDLPPRERFDLVEKVAQYLVLAGGLDKTSALEDYERANELSLELAMLLPAALYRAMIEAAAQPGGAVNPATVAVMRRRALVDEETDALPAAQIAFHAPSMPERPRGRSH